MKKVSLFLIPVFWLLACTPTSTDQAEEARREILAAERAFAAMALAEGVPAAFLAFAADSAVLNRNDRIIQGREAMRAYFDQTTLQNVRLEWEPEFVDASAAGDMGYTYGPYQFSAVDTSGQEIRATGIFHTVWKKQADGEWRFVYD